ncbi:MAG: outer membrane lipoprotein-sorting protein, partial [Candidatus Cloacimonadota bacterium]|nr:outer membrane lipoprotein-sorting protein [Candidatus Cloacimonadota bacterium]
KILRQEKFNGEDCYVVESLPKKEDYMYSKTITWVVKDKWIGQKREFYDEDGDLLKILQVEEVKLIKDCWIITNSKMHNRQTDHKTIMKLENVTLNTGIDDNKFTERMMRRGL